MRRIALNLQEDGTYRAELHINGSPISVHVWIKDEDYPKLQGLNELQRNVTEILQQVKELAEG